MPRAGSARRSGRCSGARSCSTCGTSPGEGWANQYYAAAVQAGTQSWHAFFFGSLDASNFITVDKPPFSLWVMELSARVFGLSSWSLLVPQAIAGALTVFVTYLIVRRWFGPVAALLSGLALALTPVAALMFRFDNPDAILTLLLVLGAYALVRAVEGGRTRWLVAAGAVIGCAFLAKSLQAYLVLPAFGLTWLVAAPGGIGRRLWQLAAGVGALFVASAWWVAVVELTPAGSRPYIGGSTDNSVLNLIFNYNGFGRLTGQGGGAGGASASAARPASAGCSTTRWAARSAGCCRFAGIALVAGLFLRGRAPRTDRRRAGYVLWGVWALTHLLVFSFMSGIVHSYYTVAMAPAVAALVGMGGRGPLAGARATRARAGCSRWPSRPPACGRTPCSTARRPSSPGCAGPCCWWPSPPPPRCWSTGRGCRDA